jgi:hypothetical protein
MLTQPPINTSLIALPSVRQELRLHTPFHSTMLRKRWLPAAVLVSAISAICCGQTTPPAIPAVTCLLSRFAASSGDKPVMALYQSSFLPLGGVFTGTM